MVPRVAALHACALRLSTRPPSPAVWLRPGGVRHVMLRHRRVSAAPWTAFSTAADQKEKEASAAEHSGTALPASSVHTHGGHDHGHHHHHHSHGVNSGPSGPSISERFARGEGLVSILLATTTKKSSARLAGVALGCLLSYLDVAVAAGLPFDVIGAATTVLGGWPVLKEASEHLRQRRVTLSLSMSIGILAALGSGETFVASLMTLVVLISEELEHLTVERSRASVRNMVATLPEEAETVLPDGTTRKVPLSSIKAGDIVRIPAGALIPVDGTIVSGTGSINEASITGEPTAARKRPGDAVFAGSINQTHTLDVRASAVGDATIYGRVVTTVQQAESQRAPIELLADRVAKAVVYFAFVSSAATLAATGTVSNAVSVLVVAGACGIAAGTPLAVIGGIGRAARLGCVLKGGGHLEALANIDTVCFDKTGTLTRGQPAVISTRANGNSFTIHDLYVTAYAVESRSDHPMARAVSSFVKEELGAGAGLASQTVTEHEELQGLGVRCRVDGAEVLVGNTALLSRYNVDLTDLEDAHENESQNNEAFDFSDNGGSGSGGAGLPRAAASRRGGSSSSSSSGSSGSSGSGSSNSVAHAPAKRLHQVSSRVCVAINGKLAGVFRVADAVRPEALNVLEYLRKHNVRTIILSGDRNDVVSAVAEDLGIAEALSEQSPMDKAEYIEKLVASGRRVAMVGDGINDAAAMAKATVGVAMGQASALTQQVAGAVILHNNLERFTDAIQVSKKVKRIIYQNVVGTVGVDVVGTWLAYLGILDPVLAASCHGLWDVLFLLNSGRLLMHTEQQQQQ